LRREGLTMSFKFNCAPGDLVSVLPYASLGNSLESALNYYDRGWLMVEAGIIEAPETTLDDVFMIISKKECAYNTYVCLLGKIGIVWVTIDELSDRCHRAA
jgi:hypothetical protein